MCRILHRLTEKQDGAESNRDTKTQANEGRDIGCEHWSPPESYGKASGDYAAERLKAFFAEVVASL